MGYIIPSDANDLLYYVDNFHLVKILYYLHSRI